MNTREITAEAARIAVSATPGAGGAAWTAADGQFLLSIAVGVVTLVLVVLQIAHLVWKWRRDAASAGVRP